MTSTRALRGPFDYRLPEELAVDVNVGSMLVVPFGRREVLGVVVGLSPTSDVAEEKLLAPLRALELGVPQDLVELAEWIAAEYCSTVPRALGLVLPPGAAKRLSGRRRRAVPRPTHLSVGARSPDAPELTAQQRAALEPLTRALAAGRHESRLLHGVTGSGKTEVYLQAAAAALEQGRGAIILVPEIALTPQIVGRFIERFGETVAVLHSRLRPAERYAEWRRLREGEAPGLRRPALGGVRADQRPRPDRRRRGARLLLQARVRPALRRPRRRRRAGRARRRRPGPRQRDTAARRACTGCAARSWPSGSTAARCRRSRSGHARVRDGLHALASQALADVRAERAKAIVLLNRRGWSNFLSCRSCGRVWRCPDCDVALVLHRGGGYVACHHCGHREPAPSSCPDCSSTAVARHGAGTERLAHELSEIFDDGGFPVFRLDADSLSADAPDGAPAAGLGRCCAGSRQPRAGC